MISIAVDFIDSWILPHVLICAVLNRAWARNSCEKILGDKFWDRQSPFSLITINSPLTRLTAAYLAVNSLSPTRSRAGSSNRIVDARACAKLPGSIHLWRSDLQQSVGLGFWRDGNVHGAESGEARTGRAPSKG